MPPFDTAQQAQTSEWFRDVARLLERLGGDFATLRDSTQRALLGHTQDIARLNDNFGSVRAQYAERFKALAGTYQTGRLRHGFHSDENARDFGRLVRAVHQRDSATLHDLQQAGITPGTGPEGGYLLREQIIGDIMRELDDAGIFLADCPPTPVNSLSGGSPKGTSEPSVYHPRYGIAATLSTPGFGGTHFELLRYVAAVEVDNWMLGSELTIALAEYVRQEIIYAIALASDTEWFVGDGTSAYGQFTGLFKLAAADGVRQVIGDSGDDTFNEIIDKSTHYLAQMWGQLPDWARRAGPRWYIHPVNFFRYLGVRDSGGMPLASIYLRGDRLDEVLFGAPARLTSIAPSATAISTCFALLTPLKRSCRTYRHSQAVEFKMTDQIKWLEAITTFAADVPLDMKVRQPTGIVQLVTNSA